MITERHRGPMIAAWRVATAALGVEPGVCDCALCGESPHPPAKTVRQFFVWALGQLRVIGGKGHVGFGRVSAEFDAEPTGVFEEWAAEPGTGEALRTLAAEMS